MDPYPADAYLYQQCGMHLVEVGDDEMAVREHGVVGIGLASAMLAPAGAADLSIAPIYKAPPRRRSRPGVAPTSACRAVAPGARRSYATT
jgi:hypothetical protein